MAELMSQAIADGSVHLRWREPYVTDGVGQLGTGLPAGCYRGFWIDETAVPSWGVRLRATGPGGTAAGVADDCFLMHVDASTGYGLAVREAADIVVDLTGTGLALPLAADVDLWIWADVTYVPNVATTALYRISDADPRGTYPAAVVLGVLHVAAGASVVRLTTGAVNAEARYTIAAGGDRTLPQATPREAVADYVAGDRTVGLMTGEDRWCLPTIDEKDALDGAATAATAANPYVTEADSIGKVFAEPTVATVALPAGQNYVDLSFATYGAFYVGKGALGSSELYFEMSEVGEALSWRVEQTAVQMTIYPNGVCRYASAVPINPAVDADANGFWGSGVRIYFDEIYSSTTATTFDLWYLKRVTYGTLSETPALAFPVALRDRYGHADTIGVRRALKPGLELDPRLLLTDQLAQMQKMERGPRSVNFTEQMLATKIFNTTYSEAYPGIGACYTTLGSVSWPRAMCYAYNDYGVIDTLLGGERFLLYSVTSSGHDRIVRREIGETEELSTTQYLDPVTELFNNVAQPPASIADIAITSMASDGRYVYIRTRWVDTLGNTWHVLTCYDVLLRTRRSTWPAAGVTLYNGAAITNYDDSGSNSQHVIVANANYVAINEMWYAMAPTATAHGISIRSKVDGAEVTVGAGNGGSTSFYGTDPRYAAGPMCSDGTNIYFTLRTPPPLPSLSHEFGIAQCTIADATLFQADANYGKDDLEDWSPTAAFGTYPRSLVYDGRYVWLSTRNAIMATPPTWVTGAPPRYASTLVFDHSNLFTFGPMAFDGKNLWFGIADQDSGFWSYTLFHMVKFNPASLYRYVDITGVVGDWTTLIDRTNVFQLDAALYNGNYDNWSSDQPFGDIVYTGDSLFFTREWWDGVGSGADVRLLCRMSNVKDL